MTIDRIIRALKDAAGEAEDCMVELDAKVQDLESENQGLREDLDVANDDVSGLQERESALYVDNSALTRKVEDLEARLEAKA